jgi:hypothetical protein
MCARLWVKQSRRGGKVDGVKRVFLTLLIVHVADLGRFYVLQVSLLHDAYWLERAGLVPATRRCGY